MRRLLTTLVSAAIAASAIGAAQAQAPRRIPDLASMAAARTDFTTARVTDQGYDEVNQFSDPGMVSIYGRTLTGAVLGRLKLAHVYNSVYLTDSTARAGNYLRTSIASHHGFGATRLAGSLVGGSVLVTSATIGKLMKIAVGDEAYGFVLRVGSKAGEIRGVFLYMRVGPVVSRLLVQGAPRVAVGLTQVSTLSRLIASRIRSGLRPVVTAPPTIAGTPRIGQPLNASPGTWGNTPRSYAYSWQRCDASGGSCTAIAGATAQTYAVAPGDAGATLRVSVVASNASGSATAISAPTAVVT